VCSNAISKTQIRFRNADRLVRAKVNKNALKSATLKVHKIENLFGSDFEFCVISLLVMLKYQGFVKNIF